jgi:hypothetical protein
LGLKGIIFEQAGENKPTSIRSRTSKQAKKLRPNL